MQMSYVWAVFITHQIYRLTLTLLMTGNSYRKKVVLSNFHQAGTIAR